MNCVLSYQKVGTKTVTSEKVDQISTVAWINDFSPF